MRNDVKIGLVLALAAAVVAGIYFFSGDPENESLALNEETQQESLEGLLASPTPTVRSTPTPTPAANPPVVVSTPAPVPLQDESVPLTDLVELPGSDGSGAGRGDAGRDDIGGTDSMADAGDETVLPGEGMHFTRDDDAFDGSSDSADDAREGDDPLATGGPVGGADDGVAAGGTAAPRDSGAGRSTAGGPIVAEEGVKLYEVQRGDSFAILAEVFYGSQRYTQFLMQANPQVQGANLLAGSKLRIPELPASLADATPPAVVRTGDAKPSPSPKPAENTATAQASPKPSAEPVAGRTYKVKRGDTFYDIADEVLGSGARWQELFELNREIVKGDPKNLRPGQVLRLPEEEKKSASAGN